MRMTSDVADVTFRNVLFLDGDARDVIHDDEAKNNSSANLVKGTENDRPFLRTLTQTFAPFNMYPYTKGTVF